MSARESASSVLKKRKRDKCNIRGVCGQKSRKECISKQKQSKSGPSVLRKQQKTKARQRATCFTCLTCWFVCKTGIHAIEGTPNLKQNVGTADETFSVVLFETGYRRQLSQTQIGRQKHDLGIKNTRCVVRDPDDVYSHTVCLETSAGWIIRSGKYVEAK